MTVEDLHDLYLKTYDFKFNVKGYNVNTTWSLPLVEDLKEYLNAVYQKGYNAGRTVDN